MRSVEEITKELEKLPDNKHLTERMLASLQVDGDTLNFIRRQKFKLIKGDKK